VELPYFYCNVLFIFVADVETVDLTSFDSAVIASTMKKYLRELPNPVIPEQFYTKFIDAASELNACKLFYSLCWLTVYVCTVRLINHLRRNNYFPKLR